MDTTSEEKVESINQMISFDTNKGLEATETSVFLGSQILKLNDVREKQDNLPSRLSRRCSFTTISR
jgi:hypothetical protein